MSNQLERRLAAPHECIEVKTYRWRFIFEVRYTAPSQAALIAAGVLDGFMLNKIATQKRGKRKDANGVKFRFWERKGVACVIRELSDMALALELPGVRDLYPDGIPDWQEPERESDRHENPYLDRKLREIAPACGDFGVTTRNRAVGRFQRMVEYVSVGPVVVPNWLTIRAHVLAARISN